MTEPSETQPPALLPSEQQLVQWGAALVEVSGHDGWKLLLHLLDNLELDVGRFGLRDEKRPREYWCGYQDAVVAVRAQLDLIVLRARELQEQQIDAGDDSLPYRLGGGDLA